VGRAHASRAVIVPSEIFFIAPGPLDRATCARRHGDTGLRAGAGQPGVQPPHWWNHEQGVIAFQNEIIKYAYYRFKYRATVRNDERGSGGFLINGQ